jgi:DNA polymerase III subunit beta
MSFLSFDTSKLRTTLVLASSISAPRATVELFTYTKIKLLADKELEFSAMNDFVSYTATVVSNNLEDLEVGAQFLIKTDLLTNAIALTADALVGLELDMAKSSIVIQGSKSKHNLRINTDLADNFVVPSPTSEVETSFQIKMEDLLALIKQGGVSVGNPRTVYQPEFLNFCFTIRKTDKKIIVATTDRYRVTRLEPKIKSLKTTIEADTKNYLLSPRFLAVVEKLSSDETVTFNFYPEMVVCSTKNSRITGRYGEGNFPDYDKIIPASFVCNFSIATADLQEGVKQVQYFARMNNESKAVKVIVKPTDKKIVFTSQTADGYASESTLDIIKYEGPLDEWEQSFNIDYLTTFLSTVKETHLLWESNPGKPSVLSPQNQKEELLYLVSGLK